MPAGPSQALICFGIYLHELAQLTLAGLQAIVSACLPHAVATAHFCSSSLSVLRTQGLFEQRLMV
jgi:hypothetical protein